MLKFRSEKEWQLRCAEVRFERDGRITQYFENSAYSKTAKDFPSEDKKKLQKLNVTQLRSYILSSQFDIKLTQE